jgi:hypothetical protein
MSVRARRSGEVICPAFVRGSYGRWPSYEGIEVKLRFPVSGELRFWRQGTSLPTSYPVGFAIPDHDPGIREREFQAAVPI